MGRSRSSARWLQRHVRDPYVRRAQAEGYRSRAAYKLLELDRRDRFLLPGARVADLGAAPGGWSQVAAAKAGAAGRVVAIDLLPVAPIPGVTVVQGDFRDPILRGAVIGALGGAADLVLSDLSPNLSGIAAVDQARAAELALLALGFAREILKPGGVFVVKLFQGADSAAVLAAARSVFRDTAVRKPAASRESSREQYLLARGLQQG